ncbi:MAG: class I SAM-dependent rRNA methyltransferase [Thermodesulfovibrionales bacterium]
MDIVHLKRTKRLLAGHLWVFSNELFENPKKYAPGSLVEVRDKNENCLGTGYINPRSLIAVRLLSREKTVIDRSFLHAKISNALRLRERLFGKADAFRMIFSEADYLPGLIVDKYGPCLVVQFLTLGIEAFSEDIIGVLDEIFAPETIVLRNDSRMRLLEGLPLGKEVVKGDLSRLPVIREDGVVFEVNPLDGQKTGFFLDQRMNRTGLKRYIGKGAGLDLFSYSGGWAMHCASAGASVTCVDSSKRALEMASRNAELNGFQDRVRCVEEDVFAFLGSESAAASRTYDFVVFDPPAFVKSGRDIKEAVKAYRELNEQCMRLLKPGGILATSSCSYHLSKELFVEMLNAASRKAQRDLRLLEMRSQSPDHPVLLSMPETEYLKCAFLLVD